MWHGEESVWLYVEKSCTVEGDIAFSWKLILDWIPTRANLAWINVLPSDVLTSCVLCNSQNLEGVSHLFLHCTVVDRIWSKFMRWLGFTFFTPCNLFVHFEC